MPRSLTPPIMCIDHFPSTPRHLPEGDDIPIEPPQEVHAAVGCF